VSLDASQTTISAELQAAQTRLLALRQARGVNQGAGNGAQNVVTPSSHHHLSTIPSHLGWRNQRFRSFLQLEQQVTPHQDHQPQIQSVKSTTHPPCSIDANRVTVHASIAQAMLKTEQVAAGRIWLLARHLDQQGCGWVSITTLRTQFTKAGASHRVCGWRQMRNLLRRGNDIFWQRDAERIWLYSQARVADKLNVDRFSGGHTGLNVADLCGTVGKVRSKLYTIFHAGRADQPIARATIYDLTGCSENTQRAYEQRSAIEIRPNYAIVAPVYTQTDKHETAWQHGSATFLFTDHTGRHGRAKQQYIARQLPNSYHVAPDKPQKRKNRRLNRALQDLSLTGTMGNSKDHDSRRYFRDAQAITRGVTGKSTLYWRSVRDSFWYCQRSEIC
jgi:hypothetical protein